MMLEGIEKIDWDSIGVPEAPRLIRNLVVSDWDIREEANDLIAQILSSDKGGEFAVYAYPFLIKLLDSKSRFGKMNILFLLCFGDAIKRQSSDIWNKTHKIFCQGIKAYLRLLMNADSDDRRDIMLVLMQHKEFAREI